MEIDENNQAEIDAIKQIITLINPSAADASKQIASFERRIKKAEDDEYLYDLMTKSTHLKSSFYVDWKYKKRFIEVINELAERYNVKIDWKGYNPDEPIYDRQEKPEWSDFEYLLDLAENQLAENQLTLWQYDTSDESYGGFIAPAKHDDEIAALGKKLEITSLAKPGESFEYVNQHRSTLLTKREGFLKRYLRKLKGILTIIAIYPLYILFKALSNLLTCLNDKINPK
jgi:hypothetical protein